jgi:MFS family permease
MYLLGCFLQAIFTLACGLSKTSTQLILFRAFSGVAASFCLPSAVSIINNAFPPGRSRNMAFASMGGGQPVGFGTGLVLGGVFADSIGWEWGFYIAAILNLVIFGFSIFHLPRPEKAGLFSWHRMLSEIDWVGALIASSCLAMLSFVLA